MMSRHYAIGMAVLVVAFGGSCTGSLLDTKLTVPTVYVLHAAPAAANSSQPLDVDVAVALPTASPGLDTERIAILRDTRQLDFYAESQWGAAAPAVAQALVVGSLQNQKKFRSVASEQARASAHYLLDLVVRDFQAEYGSADAPDVRVTFVASLIRVKDRKLIDVLTVSTTVKAERNRMSDVIAAFESSAQQAAVNLGEQAARAISVSVSSER